MSDAGYSLDIVKFATKYLTKSIPYEVRLVVPETTIEIEIGADGVEREVEKTIEKRVTETRHKIKTEAVDIVHYAAPGCRARSIVPARISHISAVGDGDGETQKMARMRWDFIRPWYENWKAGHDISIEAGKTPLAAWPGVTPEAAEQFRYMGIHTVEAIAEASDGVLQRCPVPNSRELAKQAKLFLASADKLAIIQDIAEAKAENADLKAQLDELKRLYIEMANKELDKPQKVPKRHAAEAAA